MSKRHSLRAILLKPVLLLVFWALLAGLGADVFLPQYYLQGYHPIVENGVDYYKYPRGFHFTSLRSYFLDKFGAETVVVPQRSQERVLLIASVGDVPLARPRTMSFNAYLEASTRARFHQLLRKNVYEVLQDEERDSGTGIFREFEIELPRMAIPKPFRRVLGTTARLSIDGSQKLTFSGSSTTTENAGLTESGKQKNFDLEMKQELRLRLRGTIGDKIHVNVTHTSVSEETISNPNEIEIKYVGTEDEIVQEIEAGNISLSLPSTTYVGYSASSESLFGVKSRMKIGYLELTTIVGKEEGEKTSKRLTGQSEADSVTIISPNFTLRTHYYIHDPAQLFALFTGHEEGYPPAYGENAIQTENGEWILANPNYLPADGTVKVYLDDFDYSNNEIATIEGHSIDANDTYTYNFEELIEGTDYVVNYDVGYIALNRTIAPQYAIGVVYTNKAGQQVGNSSEANLQVKMLRLSNQVSTSVTWNLEMRNVYKLPMENVKNDGFTFNVYTANADNTFNFDVPTDVETGTLGRTYIDYLRLDTNADGQINGDDATVNLVGGYVIFPFLRPFDGLGDEIIYEKERESVSYDEYNIKMYATGDIGRDQISLNQMNVLKGSVKVTVNGQSLTENVDYIVDYDFGTITFLTPAGKDPDADIVIDFEYKPIFAVESKTMAGVRAEMKFSDSARLGSTFIYHSERVADKRPKIGNENRTQIMADLDGEISFDPPFMTWLVDKLPLVRTDEDSKLSLSGEVALNLPTIYGNPDKKDDPEAYIDDMESILSMFPFGVTRSGWVQGSEPYNSSLARADMNWWNPPDVYAYEVYEDSLLTEDEQDERVSMLCCKVMPTGLHMPGVQQRYWGGLMKYVGNRLDFSEKKYIEVMVRVDTTKIAPSGPVIMHIDMGDISEDFYTDFGGLGVLNTEDGKNGGEKDGLYDFQEDVGLDGIKTGEPGDDPEDNFDADKVAGEFPYINGTEGNKQLDSEDLDANGNLDTVNRYFDYAIDLNGSSYLESANSKGFRIYRIPLLDSDVYQEVASGTSQPEHDEISYVRMWFEVTDTTYVDIVNVDVVGNKWESQPIREVGNFISDDDVSTTVLESNNEGIQVGITDNIENTHYTAPPETTDKEEGVETLEQSLVVDYTNLHSDHYGIVRQKFQDSYNLLAYGKLRFFVYPELEENEVYPDSIEVMLRLGADSLNFYEVGIKVKPYAYDMNPAAGSEKMQRNLWYDYEIDFSDLTYLKVLDDDLTIVVADTVDNITYRRVRNATLSNIKEMSLGVRMPHSAQPYSGRVYFNDIRVADPFDDPGYAARTTFTAKFADFMSFDATLSWQTANFYTINTGTRTGNTNTSQQEKVDLTVNNRLFLHKFFPTEWGMNIPLALNYTQSEKKPRFQANSDILVEDLEPEERERQTTRTERRSASLGISQTRTPSNWLLAYTVKNTTLNGDISQSVSTGPTAADTTLSYTEKLTYNLDIPKDKVGLGLWGDYKVYFVPQSFHNSYTFKASYPRRWRWEQRTEEEDAWVPVSQTVNTRTLDTSNSITYDIFSDFRATYSLATNRNLLWKSYWNDINIGREKTRRQEFDFGYDPRYTEDYVAWNAGLNIKYTENQRQNNIASNPDLPEFSLDGDVTRAFDLSVTLKNRDMLNGLLSRLGADAVNMRTNYTPQYIPPAGDDKSDDKGDTIEDELKTGRIDFGDDMYVARGEPPVLPPDEPLEGDQETPPGVQFQPEGDKLRPSEEKPLPEDTIIADEEELGDIVDGEEPEEAGRRFNPFVTALQYLARLENIQASWTNTYGTQYDDLTDSPDFLYQISIPHVLVGDDIVQKNNNDNFTASTGLPILNNLSTRWNYSYAITRKYNSSASSQQTITQVFPNVSATLGQLETMIGIEDWLSNSSLSSSFTLTRKQTGEVDWDEPATTSITTAMNPLLSWSGKWSFDLDTSVSYSTNNTRNITHRDEVDDLVNTVNEQRINVNLVHRLSAAHGIKLPFMKRWILKNEFTTTFDVTYERKNSQRDNGDTVQTEINSKAYKFRLSGSYNFHRNVEGGSQVTYDWTHNLKRDQVIKTFGLSVWVRILF